MDILRDVVTLDINASKKDSSRLGKVSGAVSLVPALFQLLSQPYHGNVNLKIFS